MKNVSHKAMQSLEDGPLVESAAVTNSKSDSLRRWRLGELLKPASRRFVQAMGCLLLALWCCWWISGYSQRILPWQKYTWVSVPCFGADFLGSLDLPARTWVSGKDPYADPKIGFFYPQLVLPAFSWTSLMTPDTALAVWLIVLGIIASVGAWTAWKTRRELKLRSIPLPWMLVAVLFSTPVVLSMERTNYDLISVLLVIAAVFFHQKEFAARRHLGGHSTGVCSLDEGLSGSLGSRIDWPGPPARVCGICCGRRNHRLGSTSRHVAFPSQ